MLRFQTICLFVIVLCDRSDCLHIDGCPLLGCRPSGSFSMYLNIPRKNATVAWETKLLDPVPNALGCVADRFNIMCQSNGPFEEDTGYVSLAGVNGTIRWRDKILRFPSLPIMDNFGDVTGSDGTNLVHYDIDGNLYPVIPCKEGMKPIFSMNLLGSRYMLMASENGAFSIRATNGIPISFIYLNATIKGAKGLFLPLSQPVVNGKRFYVMTYFVPSSTSKDELLVNQRLYAIDVHQRMTKIITIAWYYSFQPFKSILDSEIRTRTVYSVNNKVSAADTSGKAKNRGVSWNHMHTGLIMKQAIMWDGTTKRIYVIIKPANPLAFNGSLFLALKDNGKNATLDFDLGIPVDHMTTFEHNTGVSGTSKGNSYADSVWLGLNNGTILSMSKNGSITRWINLRDLLKANVTITSEIMTTRANDSESDTLLMAVRLSNPGTECFTKLNEYGITDRNVRSLIIAIGTSSTEPSDILWMVAVPGNLEVKGQIAGSLSLDTKQKDRIVFYAEQSGKSASIIAIG